VRATPAQTAALLVALRAKGESVGTSDQSSGHAGGALRRVATRATLSNLVGTGGDRLRSFNVTTLAAIITAGAGGGGVKARQSAASSRWGPLTCWQALGSGGSRPVGVARCVAEVGMGFCFAPASTGHAIRRACTGQLGIPTVFNVLGPLANPARATRQLVG